MFNYRLSRVLFLLGVVCSPLALADSFSSSPDVCLACSAGPGAYPTLGSQQQACQACLSQQQEEQSGVVPEQQGGAPVTVPVFSNFHFYVGALGGWVDATTTGQEVIQVSPNAPPDNFGMDSTTNSYLYGGDIGTVFRLGSTWVPTGYLSFNAWEIGSFDANIIHTYAQDGSVFNSSPSVNVFTGLFNASVDIYRWYGLAPFVGGGIGWGDAHVGNFTESFVSGQNPSQGWTFDGATTQLFVYDIIAGLHYQLANHWQVQVNYMWLPIGTIKTGSGDTSLVSVPPLTTRLVTNDVVLAIHYIF